MLIEIQEDPEFMKNISWTAEAKFTKEGIFFKIICVTVREVVLSHPVYSTGNVNNFVLKFYVSIEN